MKICLTSLQIRMYLSILTTLTTIILTMIICKKILFIFLLLKSHNLKPQLHFNFVFVSLTHLIPFFLNPLVEIVPHQLVVVIVHPTISAITLTPIITNLKHVLPFPLKDVKHFRFCHFHFRDISFCWFFFHKLLYHLVP